MVPVNIIDLKLVNNFIIFDLLEDLYNLGKIDSGSDSPVRCSRILSLKEWFRQQSENAPASSFEV